MSDDSPQIDAADFRAWLAENHDAAESVWLTLWKRSSGRSTPTIGDAIDQALCFGWVDSKSQTIDADRYRVYFCPRRAGSGWSRINKEKVARLVATGDMTAAGLAAIERAQADGSWTILDGPEAGTVPPDLASALTTAGVGDAYEALTFGQRKAILTWLVTAKRDATRANRIAKTVEDLAAGRSPLD